ncbi:4414_t:CDS:2, partial [Acaulospora morrowiae]
NYLIVDYSHLAWVNTPRNKGGLGNITIPLVADKNHSISKDYGVLIEEEGISLRGLFIIDGNGVIRQITINDLPVGRNVDEVLRLVEAFQFTDEHGEVCPIDWRKGDKTIIPDPKNSQGYFSEHYKQ